jgi:hypothetical protein
MGEVRLTGLRIMPIPLQVSDSRPEMFNSWRVVTRVFPVAVVQDAEDSPYKG